MQIIFTSYLSHCGLILSQSFVKASQLSPSIFCHGVDQEGISVLSQPRQSRSLLISSGLNMSVSFLLDGRRLQFLLSSRSQPSSTTSTVSNYTWSADWKAFLACSDIPGQTRVQGTCLVPKKYEGGSALILHRLVISLVLKSHVEAVLQEKIGGIKSRGRMMGCMMYFSI